VRPPVAGSARRFLSTFAINAAAGCPGREAMKAYLDCIPCFMKQGLDAARTVSDDTRVHEQVIRDVLRLTAEVDRGRPPPWVGRMIHRNLRQLIGAADPYRAIKSRFNRWALGLLPGLADDVRQSDDGLAIAARLASFRSRTRGRSKRSGTGGFPMDYARFGVKGQNHPE
jgi:hypothetical protein